MDLMRLPSDDARVFELGADGKPVAVDAACPRPSCLRANDAAVVIVGRDGAGWATWEGHPGAPLAPPGPLEEMSTQERWARREVDRSTAPLAGPGVSGGPRDPPAGYSSTAELRTCGNTFAGGGVGWHIIRNADDVWQRIEWTHKPTDPAVLALAPDAYPLADGLGALCGWARQKRQRHWEVHSIHNGVVVEAAPDFEHPPAHCTPDGAIIVNTRGGGVKLRADGALEPSALTAPGTAPVRAASIAAAVSIMAPQGTVQVQMHDGTPRALVLPEDRDLLKRPWAPGTVRERLVLVGDRKQTLLINERIRLADCTVRETLLTLDVHTGGAALVAEGDLVFLRLSHSLGRFWWVEAAPRLIDVSG